MEEENGYELDTLWKIHQGVGDFPGIKVIHLLVGGVSRLMKMVKSIQMKTVQWGPDGVVKWGINKW